MRRGAVIKYVCIWYVCFDPACKGGVCVLLPAVELCSASLCHSPERYCLQQQVILYRAAYSAKTS